MKSFEVKVSVTGQAKNQTKSVFVSANSKKEIQSCEGVLKIWERKDIIPSECPMEVDSIFNVIIEK